MTNRFIIFAKMERMRAIEINSRTDKTGHLRIDYQLDTSEKDVRILILVDDEKSEIEEEKLLLNYISNNPSFNFLNDPKEDIYSINDGEAFND